MEPRSQAFKLPDSFCCLWVERLEDGTIRRGLAYRPLLELPPGEVLIRTEHSSLNYKDALAAAGHPGVVTSFPHVPGIDAAGRVAQSQTADFSPGDAVVVTGWEMGSGRWGGWAEWVRVPREWVLLLPPNLNSLDAMTYGTAGLTAAMCVQALLQHGAIPERGDVVVTGASGGVGSLAVAILAKLGFHVTAVTGKPHAISLLRSLGASDFLSRDQAEDKTDKPLLSGRWAGAVDTVGGRILTTLLRSVKHGGCVAACGLAASNRLDMTVYPFILRGITLVGIDAAYARIKRKAEIWSLLADAWRVERLPDLRRIVPLESLEPLLGDILAGKVMGRTVVELAHRHASGSAPNA